MIGTNDIAYVQGRPIQKADSRISTTAYTTRTEAPPSTVTLFRILTTIYRRPSWKRTGFEPGWSDLRNIARADGANTIAWPV